MHAGASVSQLKISGTCKVRRTVNLDQPARVPVFRALSLQRTCCSSLRVCFGQHTCSRHRYRQACSRGALHVTCGFPNFKKPSPMDFDATMLWGDGVMICATELASDRIPLTEAGVLSGIMLGIWVVVGGLKGDYKIQREPTVFFNAIMLDAMTSSMMTWMIAVPLALAVYSYLVPGQIIDAITLTLASDAPSNALPPQLEVMMADLITLCCWRGIYALLRL